MNIFEPLPSIDLDDAGATFAREFISAPRTVD